MCKAAILSGYKYKTVIIPGYKCKTVILPRYKCNTVILPGYKCKAVILPGYKCKTVRMVEGFGDILSKRISSSTRGNSPTSSEKRALISPDGRGFL